MLYHLDRAKEAIRQGDAVVLVEGYMDAIAVARAGIGNVVASCGTSLTETQVKLLSRFTRRVIVNYDPDTAGQAATERSLAILLEQNCDVRVLALPGGKDPDSFIRAEGAEAYRKLLAGRAAVSRLPDRPRAAAGHRHGGRKTARGEFPAAVRAAHSQRAAALGMGLAHLAAVARGRAGAARSVAPRRRRAPQRSEDAAGAGRRAGEAGGAAPGANADGSGRVSRAPGGRDSRQGELHRGLETEKIFAALLEACAAGERPDMAALAPALEERDRRLLFEIAFEGSAEAPLGGGRELPSRAACGQLRPQLRHAGTGSAAAPDEALSAPARRSRPAADAQLRRQVGRDELRALARFANRSAAFECDCPVARVTSLLTPLLRLV